MEIPYLINDVLDTLMQRKGDPADLVSTLHHITQTAHVFFEASCCSIFAINPITRHFTASQTVTERTDESEDTLNQPYPELLVRQTLERGSIQIDDLDKRPEYQNLFTQAHDIRSLVAYPLRIQHNQKPLGILCLYFKRLQAYIDEDEITQKTFHVFLTQASFLLQQTWLLRRHQEVARIGQEINQDLSDIETLFKKLRKHVAGILDMSASLLLVVYEPQTNIFDIYLQEKGRPFRRELRVPEGACLYVLETQEKQFIQHLSEEKKNQPFLVSHIPDTEVEESLIYIPLLLHNTSLGVLSIQHPLPYTYDQEDVFILQMLANHIALALWNIRLYSSLSLLNETGQLLTRQTDSKRTLEATAKQILDTTKADVVVLYPYFHLKRDFIKPYIAGTLQDPNSRELMIPRRMDDIARLMLNREKPLFADEASKLYTLLASNITSPQGNFQHREGIRSATAARLVVGNEIVGVLFVNFRQPQSFDSPQSLLIEGLSHFAAIAMNNARTLDKMSQRRIHELEILQKVDQALNRHLELQSVLDTLLYEVSDRKIVPADGAGILIYNLQTEFLETRAAIGRNSEARRRVNIPFEGTTGITRWVLEHKETARVMNVQTEERWRDQYIPAGDNTRTVSELDVPLLDGEEVVGVLNFESEVEAAFSEEDQNFLETLAGQVVLAVKTAQAYEREKRLAADHRALNEISKEIVAQFDQRRIFNLILDKALELTHSNLGNLMLYDPLQQDLWVAEERNIAEDKKNRRQRLDEGIVGRVARTKKLINANLTRSPDKDIYLEYFPGAKSELAVPMLQGGELRGVLNIESPIAKNFSPMDEELLQGLADLAVIALRNAEQYEAEKLEASRFRSLYEAGKELGIVTTLDQLEQAYDTILRIAKQHCNGQIALRRYNEEIQELVAVRSSHPEHIPPFQTMKIDEGINGQVARERHTISIVDAHKLPKGIGPAKLSDPETRSLAVIPVIFHEHLYGTLGVSHKEVGHFKEGDILFFEGLAQQLASTIYRLETEQESQELEQRALAADLMTNIGQSAFELIHRLGNEWGHIELSIDNIRDELEEHNHMNAFIAERLEKIVQIARTTLGWSKDLKSRVQTSTLEKMDEPVVTDARIFLEEAQSLVPLPSSPPIQLRVESAKDVGAVLAIHGLVLDILRNLIDNAITAMPRGGTITLTALNEGRYVALKVIDSGVGIPLHIQKYIFNPFYSTKGSSGFGLWSAQRNAYRNNGELKVESQPGQGATFTLLLPRADRNTGCPA
ncbi:GAF domain-containing protein [Dictyobacter formicarum]|uniref:histidine kinase n=1 Tax=Dictyobacter formicarum TaxID=2778368 RepID=A0ABQ3V8G7_9CHLR|nr:GAF domain-containing protein [Dictyobacter formicarum]GHO82195.1 hypothetical protein KSZ_02010 [Dictyobacter formicarum]